MNKTEYITNLETKVDNLNAEIGRLEAQLNENVSNLNQLINRLVNKTIDYSHENESCVEGTVDFLHDVIGNLRTKEWILTHFSRDFSLVVNFTVAGGGDADSVYHINADDLTDFIKTYIDQSDIEVKLSHYDISEDV